MKATTVPRLQRLGSLRMPTSEGAEQGGNAGGNAGESVNFHFRTDSFLPVRIQNEEKLKKKCE